MAKKSKTQKAKASAARQARKAAKDNKEVLESNIDSSDATENKSTKFFGKNDTKKADVEKTPAQLRQERRDAKMAAKENKKPKEHGKIVQFFIDVKAEMKRVTWPEKKDVKQWTGVVVAALIFFGCYVAVLDNFIWTPVLLFISQLAG